MAESAPWEDYKGGPWDDYAGGTASAEPATMTKTAAPQPEGFAGHLVNEFTSGIRQAYEAASDLRPISGPLDPKALNVPLGLLRAAASPITAMGHAAGESVLDTTLPMMGPTGAAITATVADLGTQIMASPAAVAKAAPKATQAMQWLAGKLPGAQVALRELGKKTIEAWPSALRPTVSSDILFDQLKQTNPTLSLPRFQKAAETIANREATLDIYGLADRSLSTQAGKSARAAADTAYVPEQFSVVQDIRKRIGDAIGEARVTGDKATLGTNKYLFRELSADLDAQTGPAFAKLKEANAAAKTEFAIGQLDDIFDATMGKALEGRSITSSSFAQALNKVKALRKDDKLFEDGIGAANLDKIESRLNELRQLKILPPPASANVGSYQRVGQATVGGALAHHVLGTDPVTSMAIGLGVPWVISRAVQSKGGMKLLEGFLSVGGQLDPRSIAAIVGAVRLDDPKTKEFLKSFPDVMQSANVPTEVKMKQAMEKHKLTQEVQIPSY